MTDDKMREAFEAKLCPYRGSPDPWVVWQAAWHAATQAQVLSDAQQRGREITAGIAKCVEKGERMDDEPLFVFEHEDGRRITCRADDARLVGEPAWHRVGPVDAERDAVLVKRSTLMSWKDEVNTIAALSLKAERHEHGAELKQAIADVLAMPPAHGPTDAGRNAVFEAAVVAHGAIFAIGREPRPDRPALEAIWVAVDAAMRATPADGGEG